MTAFSVFEMAMGGELSVGIAGLIFCPLIGQPGEISVKLW
jgi:hypothetical protein